MRPCASPLAAPQTSRGVPSLPSLHRPGAWPARGRDSRDLRLPQKRLSKAGVGGAPSCLVFPSSCRERTRQPGAGSCTRCGALAPRPPQTDCSPSSGKARKTVLSLASCRPLMPLSLQDGLLALSTALPSGLLTFSSPSPLLSPSFSTPRYSRLRPHSLPPPTTSSFCFPFS